MRFLNSKLKIENTILQNIAKKYGTPAYCYSYKQLRENINDFKKNFKSISPLICFAIKSNTNLNLIKEIKKFGLGADVASQLDGNNIEMFLNDSGSPALIKDPGDFDSIFVVMPMKG